MDPDSGVVEGLTTTQWRALELFLEPDNPNQETVGERIGVSRRTITRWVALPAWKAAYQAELGRLREAARDILMKHVEEVATQLYWLALHAEKAQIAQVRACEVYLQGMQVLTPRQEVVREEKAPEFAQIVETLGAEEVLRRSGLGRGG